METESIIDYEIELKKFMDDHNRCYQQYDSNMIKIIYDLYIKNIIPPIDEDNGDLLFNLGKYYDILKEDDKIIKYYSMAIEKKNYDCNE